MPFFFFFTPISVNILQCRQPQLRLMGGTEHAKLNGISCKKKFHARACLFMETKILKTCILVVCIQIPFTHLENAVTVLRQGCGGVGGVHFCELFSEITDVELIPNHGLERCRYRLRCQVLPVNFLR